MIRTLYSKLLQKSNPTAQNIETSDLQKILDGNLTYAQLTIGEKHNPTQRKKDNKLALELMDTLRSEAREATEEEKQILAKYSGDGGLGGIGSDDEYYTPEYIAQGAWDMLGGIEADAQILDPSAGMGIFSRTSPFGAKILQIELSDKSAELNSAITGSNVLKGSFETRSYDIEDNSMDGIITNVPFADAPKEGLADKSPQFNGLKRIEHYFILRSLELLKYGKRAVFVVPTSVLDNKAGQLHEYKKKILNLASFVGGVRLPNKIFSHTGADVAVDILVFEKHREDAYNALNSGVVRPDSREEIIFENEANRAFIFGYYFDKPIGKRYMLGTKITSNEFKESRFLGETKFPKTAILTEDDLDTLKAKVLKLFKQAKFANTTEYDKLQLVNDKSILDQLSLNALSELDSSLSFFRSIAEKMQDGEKVTSDNLEEYKRRYVQLSNIGKEGTVVKSFKSGWYYLPLMAINYVENINELTSEMLETLIFAFTLPKKFASQSQEDEFKEKIKLLKIISDKAYASKFKDKSDTADKNRANYHIGMILGRMTIKIHSLWDMEKNEKAKELEFNKFQSLHDLLALKGRKNEITENGDYDAAQFTSDEILNIDDMFLSADGGIIPMAQLAYDGARFGDAMDYVASLSYEKGKYGLTKEEFDQKIAQMVSILEGRKKTVDFNSLQLDHKSLRAIAHESDKAIIRGIEEDIINSLDLIYIKADLITSSDKDEIDFPSSISIKQFYAQKTYDSNFRKLWELYEDDIKAALGVKDYTSAMGAVDIAYRNVTSKRNAELGRQIFEKIKPIIIKDIRSKKQQFDISLETQIRMNPIVTAKIKSKLENDSTIRAGGENDHERIDFLGEYVNTSILDSNHGFQNEDIRHFSSSMKGIIAQDTGLGKALLDTELVLTPNGFVENGTLKVGDYVIGSNGKPTMVKGVYPQGKMDIYRVSFIDGTTVDCTGDHIWTINERSGKNKHGLTNKTVFEMLEKPIEKEIKDSRYGTTQKEYRYSIPFTPECEFDNGFKPLIDPYILGYLIGNGSMAQGSISVVFKNSKYMEKVSKLLPEGVTIRLRSNKANCIDADLVVEGGTKGENILMNEIKRIGLYGKTSVHKFIPKEYLYSSLESRKKLFQGLVDSDGHILKSGNIEYGTSSKQLIEDYRTLALSIGKKLGKIITKENPAYTYNGEKRISENAAYRITERTSRAKRKSIVSIEKIGNDNATCISVDAEDSLYVAGAGFNLTHNTVTIFMTSLAAVITNRAKRAMVVVPTGVYDKWVMEITSGTKYADGKTKREAILNDKGKELISFTTASTAQQDWSKFCNDSTKRIILMPDSVFRTFSFTKDTHNFIMGTTVQDERGGEERILGAIPDFTGNDYDTMISAPANSIGYYEDGNIELLIIDEAQKTKNSTTGGKQFKFASSIKASRYGVCVRVAQALMSKKHGDSGKGTILATATPFTSTPYEIYTMLKNSGGMSMIGNMKDFANSFMSTEKREEVMATNPDKTTLVEVFEGLKNVQLLNSMGLSQVRYRNATDESERDVNIGLEKGALKPEYQEIPAHTDESMKIVNTRSELLARYELFREVKKQYEAGEVDERLDDAIFLQYGYDMKNKQHKAEVFRKASVFSLVNSLSLLSLNSKMASEGIIEFDVSEMEENNLKNLKTKLLKQKVTYRDIEVTVDKDGNEIEGMVDVETTLAKYLEMNNLQLESNGKLQLPEIDEKIIKMVLDANGESSKLLNIEDYPKYKKLLENITKELNENSKAKQLVFSISLSGARLIEYFVKHLYNDIGADHKIMNAVDIAKTKKSDDDEDNGALANFQEEYNNSNIPTLLIFTTKNSTGVDFNVMTKAIHLVEIPYTPDVWHQAMGRGVRQGNKVEKVNVYQYSTAGTIDMMKLRILAEKGEWQEELKTSEGKNQIVSIQTDGEKIIQQALAKNINATEEDVQKILDEQKSQRAKIVQEEHDLKVKSVKRSLLETDSLVDLLNEGNSLEIFKKISIQEKITFQSKAVDISVPATTPTNILKNIKLNGYAAIHHFFSQQLITEEFLKEAKEASKDQQQAIVEKRLGEIDFSLESTNTYRFEYLNKILLSVYKKRENAKEEGRRVLTDEQYKEATTVIDEYVRRAKADIEARVLKMLMAEDIKKEVAKQTAQLVSEDEKELYELLAVGKAVYAQDSWNSKKELLKIEDTYKIFKEGYDEYIELPEGMLSKSYTLKIVPKSDNMKFIRYAPKTGSNADYVRRYNEKIENNKDIIEKNRDKILKYFNTDIEKPVLTLQTLKPLNSIVEFASMIKFVKTSLKSYSDIGNSLRFSDMLQYINREDDEIVTIDGDTFAIIDNKIFASRTYLSITDCDISDVAQDDRYAQAGTSEPLFSDTEYNYKLLIKISGESEETLKEFAKERSGYFRADGNVIYPVMPFVKELERHKAKQEIQSVLSSGIDGTALDEIKEKDLDTLKAYLSKASDIEKALFYKSVLNGDIKELKGVGAAIKEILSADDNKITTKTKYDIGKKTIAIISDDFDILLENTRILAELKPSSGWQGYGVGFDKYGIGKGFNEDGKTKSIRVGWKIKITSPIIKERNA